MQEELEPAEPSDSKPSTDEPQENLVEEIIGKDAYLTFLERLTL